MRKILVAMAIVSVISASSAFAQGVRNYREATGKRVIKTAVLQSVASRKAALAKKRHCGG